MIKHTSEICHPITKKCSLTDDASHDKDHVYDFRMKTTEFVGNHLLGEIKHRCADSYSIVAMHIYLRRRANQCIMHI